MKKIFVALIIFCMTILIVACSSTSTTTANNNRSPNSEQSIPQELIELLPPNTKHLTALGQTIDNKKCKVEISHINQFSYSIDLSIYNEDGSFNPKRMGKFQIGFGHYLKTIKKDEDKVQAISEAPAGNSYSSDQRSEMIAKKGSAISAIRILNSEKGFFGWSTKSDISCLIN